MREPNLEELRASGALQDAQVSSTAFQGPVRQMRLRHAQIGSWWERVLAVIGIGILALALIVNLWGVV